MECRRVNLFLDSNGALDLSFPESSTKKDMDSSHSRRSPSLANVEPEVHNIRSHGLDVPMRAHGSTHADPAIVCLSDSEEPAHYVDTYAATVRDQELYITALNLENAECNMNSPSLTETGLEDYDCGLVSDLTKFDDSLHLTNVDGETQVDANVLSAKGLIIQSLECDFSECNNLDTLDNPDLLEIDEDNAEVSELSTVSTPLNMCDIEDSHRRYADKECNYDGSHEQVSNSPSSSILNSSSPDSLRDGSNSAVSPVHDDNSHDSSVHDSNSIVYSVHLNSASPHVHSDSTPGSPAHDRDSSAFPEHDSNSSYSPSHKRNITGSLVEDSNSPSSVIHNSISPSSPADDTNAFGAPPHNTNSIDFSARGGSSPGSPVHDGNSLSFRVYDDKSVGSPEHNDNSPVSPEYNDNCPDSPAHDGNSSDSPAHDGNSSSSPVGGGISLGSHPRDANSSGSPVHNETSHDFPVHDDNYPDSLVCDIHSPDTLVHNFHSAVSFEDNSNSSCILVNNNNSRSSLVYDNNSPRSPQHDNNTPGSPPYDCNSSGSPVKEYNSEDAFTHDTNSSHDPPLHDDNSSGSSTDCQSISGYPLYDAKFRDSLVYANEYSSSTLDDNHNADSVVSTCSPADARNSSGSLDSPVVDQICSNSVLYNDDYSTPPVREQSQKYKTGKMAKAKSATEGGKTDKLSCKKFRPKSSKNKRSDWLGKSKLISSANAKPRNTVISKVNKKGKRVPISPKSNCKEALSNLASHVGSDGVVTNLLPCVKLTKKLFVEKLGMVKSGSINMCDIPETQLDSDRDSDIDSGVYIPKEVTRSRANSALLAGLSRVDVKANRKKSKSLEIVRKLKAKIRLKSGGNTLNSNDRKAVDKTLPILKSTTTTKTYLQPTPKEIRVYNSRKDIGFHCIRERNGKITIKCDSCQYKTDNKYYIWKHIKVHGKPNIRYECNFCDFSCKSCVVYLEHEAKHTLDKPFKCEHCDYCSRNHTDFLRHQNKHLTEKCFKCPECDFVTRWRRNIRHHHIMKHNDERPYHCNICGFDFKRKHDLKNHLYRHNDQKPIQCDQCEFRCKTMYELKCHKLKHSDVRAFACTFAGCSQRTKTKSDLRKHMNTHNKERKYICGECNKGFTCTGSLSKHKQRHLEVGSWKCDICQKILRCKTSLRNHIRLHQGIYPHKCDVCGMSFSNKSNMNVHSRTHDIKDRPFRCPLCPYGARNIEQLLSHIGSTHGSQYAYFCEICNKPFKRFGQLQLHMARMHPRETRIAKKHKMKSALSELVGLDASSIQFEQVTIPSTIDTMGESRNVSSDMMADDSKRCKYLMEVDDKQNIETNSSMIPLIKEEPNDHMSDNIVDKDTDDNKARNIECNIPDFPYRSNSASFVGCGQYSEQDKHIELQHIPKPIATVVMYNGVSLPLATRGFKFNFQKTGKKPSSWFMQPENMHDDAAEKHIEFLYKKDNGLLPWVGKREQQKSCRKRGRPRKKVKEQKLGLPGTVPSKNRSSHLNASRPSTGKRRGRPPKPTRSEASRPVHNNSSAVSSVLGLGNSECDKTVAESLFLSENNITIRPHSYSNTIYQEGVSCSLSPQPVVLLERIFEDDFIIKIEEDQLGLCTKRLSTLVKSLPTPKKKRRVQDTAVKQKRGLKTKVKQKKNKKKRVCNSETETARGSDPVMASALANILHEPVVGVKAQIFPRIHANVKGVQRKVKRVPLKSVPDVPVGNPVQSAISSYAVPLDDKQHQANAKLSASKPKVNRKRKASTSNKKKVDKSMSICKNTLGSSTTDALVDGASTLEHSFAESKFIFPSVDAVPRYTIAKPKTGKGGQGIKLRIVLKKHTVKQKARQRKNNTSANLVKNKKKKGKVAKLSAAKCGDNISGNNTVIHSKSKVKGIASKQAMHKNQKMPMKPSQKSTKRAPAKRINRKKIVESSPCIENSFVTPNSVHIDSNSAFEQTKIKLEVVYEEEEEEEGILGDRIVPPTNPQSVSLDSRTQTDTIVSNNHSNSGDSEGRGLVISNVISQLSVDAPFEPRTITQQEYAMTNTNTHTHDTTGSSFANTLASDSEDEPLDLRINHDRLDGPCSGRTADGSFPQVLFTDQSVVVEPVNASAPVTIKIEPTDEEIA